MRQISMRTPPVETSGNDTDLLRAIVDATADGLLAVGLGGEVIITNRKFHEMWKIPEELARRADNREMLRCAAEELQDPEGFVSKVHLLYKSSEEDFDVLRFKDGRIFERYSRPLIQGGNVAGRVWSFRDVTQRYKSDELLRRYELLAGNSRDIILFARRKDGRILEANAAAEKAYGYSREELTGLTIFDLRADETHGLTIRQMQEAETDGILFETVHRRRDGSTFPVEVSSRGAMIDGIRTVVSVVRDTSARKEVEDALRESKASYHKLFEDAIEGIVLADADTGEILVCNRAFSQMSGYYSHELVGKPQTVLHPREEGDPPVTHSFVKHRDGKNGEVILTDLVTKCGIVKQVEIKGSTIHFGGRRIMQGFFRDVTEQLRYHRERETTLTLLRLLNSDNNTHELISSLTGLLKDWTGCGAVGVRLKDGDDFPYFETLGFPPHFIKAENYLCARDDSGHIVLDNLGNPVLECMCGNILSGRFDPSLAFFTPKGSFWTNSTTELLAATSDEDRQARTRNRCNGEGYESVALIPLRSGSETLGLLQINDQKKNRFTPGLVTFLEKTADQIAIALSQRKAAASLRKSEEHFRTLVETAPDPIFIHVDGRFVYLNKAAAALFGASSQEQLLGLSVIERLHPDYVEIIKERMRLLIEEKEAVSKLECQLVRLDGGLVDVQASGVPFEYGGKAAALAFVRDITREKSTDEALRASEARYKDLSQLFHATLEAIPDRLAIISSDLEVAWANSNAVESTQAKDKEPSGEPCYKIFHLRDVPCDSCPVLDVVESGEAASKIVSGSDGRVWEYRVIPVVDDAGSVTHAVRIGRDVTEHRNLEMQLRQAQKMEAIGTLAGGIAHDFNNILSPIIGYTQMILDDLEQGSPLGQDLQEVLRAAYRARDLVKQILAFSRTSEHEKRPVRVASLFKEVVKLLRATIPTTIDIKQSIHPGSEWCSVMADPTQIHQVMMNLSSNAAHAMRERGGVLELGLEELSLGSKEVSVYPDLVSGPHLKLTVRDTGHGMDQLTIERIFEPFFTTKGRHEGTGMGLAVVHGIVKGHGGALRVWSKPGEGSTFEVLFPAIEGTPTGVPDGASLSPPVGTEHILFVDDEEALAEMGKRMMEKLGYRVSVATKSSEALKLFGSRPDAFDLVITDFTMPRMTGLDLTREILRIRADIPVIICTGFSEMLTAERARQAGVRELIMKPVDMARLAGVIRSVLDNH